VNAFKLVNAEGKGTSFRHRITPTASEESLDEAALKDRSGSFLYDELPTRLKSGPISFTSWPRSPKKLIRSTTVSEIGPRASSWLSWGSETRKHDGGECEGAEAEDF